WGFASAAHFSRIFRAVYGISPVDYRHHTYHVARQKSGGR
ncbi:AraC family transcriptional regulator, partial [Streptomyces anulatus]